MFNEWEQESERFSNMKFLCEHTDDDGHECERYADFRIDFTKFERTFFCFEHMFEKPDRRLVKNEFMIYILWEHEL